MPLASNLRHRFTARLRAAGPRFACLLAGTTALWLLATIGAWPAAAQIPGAPSPAPETKIETPQPPAVEPIAISEIGVKSERAKRDFQEVAEGLGPTEEVETIRKRLPDLDREIAKILKHSAKVRASEPSLAEIDDLESGWKDVRAEMQTLQDGLGKRADEIQGQLEGIQKQQEVWKVTRESLVATDVDSAVIAQVEEVERAVKKTLDQAKERQAAVLTLQSHVAKLSESAKADIKGIDSLREQLVGRVLQRDQPPIWSAEFWSSDAESTLGQRLEAEHGRRAESARKFWEEDHEDALLHLVATLIFGALMFLLRPRILHEMRADEDMERVRAIFEHPLSLTLLSSFFVAFLWISPSHPSLTPIIGAAALFPAVVILRRLLDPPVYPMLNALVVFFVIDRMRALVSPLPVLSRLLHIAELTAIVVLVLYWLRPARLKQIPAETADSMVFRLVGLALRLALLQAVLGLLAETMGFSHLARVLSDITAMAGYAGVVLYGAVRVTDGLIAFALRVPPLTALVMVRRRRRVIQSKLDRGVQLAAWVLWIVAVLDSGGQLAPVLSGLESLAASTLPIPGAEVELGNLLGSGLLLYFTFLLSRLIRFILAEEIFPRLDLPKGSPYAISALTHYTVLTLGFVLAANALGLGLNRFTLLAGAFGVGIGFGLQTIVNNFVSGIILLTERPVEVGDTISLSGAFGEVGRIGIRSSTVRTWQGAEIIVPNADLIAQQVTNWTLSDRRRRLEIQVGVAYGSQPRQVIEVLKQAATRVDRVLTEPEPYVLFTGFGDSSLDFELRCWTDDFDRFLQVRSSVCVEVSDLLAQAGIVIPFPQRDLHIRDIARGDAEEPSNPSDRGHDSIDGNETD